MVYTAAFLNNMGNYRGFGDTKFVPEVAQEKFFALIRSSNAGKKDPDRINFLLENISESLYSLNDNETCLSFWPKVCSALELVYYLIKYNIILSYNNGKILFAF